MENRLGNSAVLLIKHYIIDLGEEGMLRDFKELVGSEARMRTGLRNMKLDNMEEEGKESNNFVSLKIHNKLILITYDDNTNLLVYEQVDGMSQLSSAQNLLL